MSEAKPKPRRKVSKLKSGLPGIEKFSDLMRWKPAERARVLATLTTVEADALYYDWSFWGRPEQKPPPGDWVYWLILAGCGAGKTRSGAEAVREWVRDFAIVNLIGATHDDVATSWCWANPV